MRDAPDQDEEQLIIEPITWLDGSLVQQRARLMTPAWSGRLGRQGILALGEGLALLGCFSLPWFSMNIASFGGQTGPGAVIERGIVNFTGWSIAGGMPLAAGAAGQVRVALFVHLWLVPLAAAALFAIAWAHARSRLSARFASAAIVGLSGLILLVQVGYYVQVTSLASVMADNGPSDAPIFVSWGCWLAAGVCAVALVAAAGGLRPWSAREVPEPMDRPIDSLPNASGRFSG